MRSCTLSQWRDLRIWSGSEDLGAATTLKCVRIQESGSDESDESGSFLDIVNVRVLLCTSKAIQIRKALVRVHTFTKTKQ